MQTNRFPEDETHARIFRAEVSGIPLEGVDCVRTHKNGADTGLGVTMYPLKLIVIAAVPHRY